MEASKLLDPLSRRTPPATDAAAAGLAHTAQALSAGLALGPLLGTIAAGAAEALGAVRCLVYLRERDSGDLVGTVASDQRPGAAGLEWMARARIPAGAPGLDRVLAGGEVAALRLPAAGPPSLVAPIFVGDEPGGVMVLEGLGAGADAGHEYARAFAALAGAAVSVAPHQAGRRQLHALARRVRDERRLADAEEDLLRCAVASSHPADVARFLAGRLGLPCAVLVEPDGVAAFDAGGRQSAAPRLLDPRVRARREVAADLAAVDADRPAMLGPYPRLGIHSRHGVARIPGAPGDAVIVLGDGVHAPGGADLRLARRAAAVVAIELRGERRAEDVGLRESVVRDAVYGSDAPAALVRRAAAVGLDLRAPGVVALLSVRPPGDGLDAGEVRETAAALGLAHVRHLAGIPDGVVVVSPLEPSRPRHAAVDGVRDELRRLVAELGRDAVAAVSSVCRTARSLPGALEECREVAACLLRLDDPAAGVLCADDLGVGKLLLGHASPPAVERFLDDVFGALADERESAKLLETLEAFFAAGRVVRTAAARVGVHENTVRHRFRRLASVTGLDVLGSADDELTARLALTLLKLRSNVPVTKEHA